jgi:VCBS repeat-containing protein
MVSFPGGTIGDSVQVCYTPNPGAEGSDTFTITVTDSTCGSTTTITVNVTITPLACPEIAGDSLLGISVGEDSTCAGSGNTFTLTATDNDTPVGSLTWSTTPPTRGVVSFPGGTTGGSVDVCYTPNPDVNGTDSFTLSVTDGNCGGSDTVTVNVTIAPAEDCPTITQGASTSIIVAEDSACGGTGNTFTLSATDPDLPAQPLTWSTTTSPGMGTVSFPGGNTGGSVSVCYTPAANATGSDSFAVSVTDGACGGSDTITVNVTITPAADCPVIDQGAALSITVAADSTCLNAANNLSLTANDVDSPAGSLTWSATAPTQGQVTFPAGNSGAAVTACYTPNTGATGSDSFTVSVGDGDCGGTDTITVTVTINPRQCPAIDQGSQFMMTVAEDSGCGGAGNTVTFSAVDIDSPPANLAWTISSGASNGTAGIVGPANGASINVCYAPNPNHAGSDTFVVSVTDGTCGAGTTLTVNVTITPSPDCPVIDQGSALGIAVQEDSNCSGAGNTFTLSATDPDVPAGTLTWSATDPPAGTVAFPGGNTGTSVLVCYSPDPSAEGSDSFNVTVGDGTCGATTSIAISVTINPLACPSITAGSVLALNVQEDSTCGPGNTFMLTATDPDTPLASLAWSIQTQGTMGSAAFVGGSTGATVSVCYTPNANAAGMDTFVIAVTDGACGGSGRITVNVTINPVPDCPSIDQGSSMGITVVEDSSCGGSGNQFNVSATDPDLPAQSLNWSASPAMKGTVTFPNGSTGGSVAVCYTPEADATGSDSFVLTVADSTCTGGDSITVNVDITPVEDCPAITPSGPSMAITVAEDSTCGGVGNTFSLSATDPDTPAASLFWSISVPASMGTATFTGASTGASVQVCYTPNANVTGSDSFTVMVADATCPGGGTSLRVDVTIVPVADCPTIEKPLSTTLDVAEDSTCAGAGNTLTLTATDVDSPAASLTWSASLAMKGTVTFPGGNTGASVQVCYTPLPDAFGSDSFLVTVTDGTCSGGAMITLNVNITPSDDCPRIVQPAPNAITVQEDSSCGGMGNTFALSAVDPDVPRGSLLTWSASSPALGMVSFPNGNTGNTVNVCYTPNPDASGNDAFTVSVTDGTCGGSGSIRIDVTIQPVNDCPTIVGQAGMVNLTVEEDSTCAGAGNQFSLAATDPDSPPTSLLWSATTPTKGSATFVNGNGGNNVTLCYTPDANATGEDMFVVSVTDGACGGSGMVTVHVDILPVIDCPRIDKDGQLTITVQANSTCASNGNTFTLTATDPDTPAQSLTWSANVPAMGAVSFPNGNTGASVQVCYTPNADVTGADSFTVFVNDDSCEGGGSVNVMVSINPVNCPTVDQGSLISIQVAEDSACGGAGNSFALSATDDTPASLTWSSSTPNRGTVSFPGGNTGPNVQVCYTPNPDATGGDSFVVSVTDGDCGSAGTITIDVTIPPTPDCPDITQTGPINLLVDEDAGCPGAGNSLVLTATDPDSSPAALVWSASTPPAHGMVIFPNGSTGAMVTACYQPAFNYTGPDQFVLSVTDGTCGGSDSITVNVNVANIPDCPVIDQPGPIVRTVVEDSGCGGAGNTFTLSATDPDTLGADLSWSASDPAAGTVTFPAGSTGGSVQVCYTPDPDATGTDSFTVFVTDETCGAPAAITVNVNITAQPDCPSISQGASLMVSVQRDSTCAGMGNTFTLTATDPDSPAESFFWFATTPAKGAASFPNGASGNAVQVCYTPNPGASGNDAFQVLVDDKSCGSQDTINITVRIECGTPSGDCNNNGIPDNCEIADAPASDRDGDGILNTCDACPDDPANDADGDGVCGNIDQCPGTPPGTPVDAVGCPLPVVTNPCPQGDSDGDGVCNTVDLCPNTPAGTVVDATGCPPTGAGQPVPCDPNDNDTLSLLMSAIFRAPVCGCGIMLTGLIGFLGIVTMKFNYRRRGGWKVVHPSRRPRGDE